MLREWFILPESRLSVNWIQGDKMLSCSCLSMATVVLFQQCVVQPAQRERNDNKCYSDSQGIGRLAVRTADG